MQARNIEEHVAQEVIRHLMKRDEDFIKMKQFYVEHTRECANAEYGEKHCQKRMARHQLYINTCMSCQKYLCEKCFKKYQGLKCDYHSYFGVKCVKCMIACSCYVCCKRSQHLK